MKLILDLEVGLWSSGQQAVLNIMRDKPTQRIGESAIVRVRGVDFQVVKNKSSYTVRVK